LITCFESRFDMRRDNAPSLFKFGAGSLATLNASHSASRRAYHSALLPPVTCVSDEPNRSRYLFVFYRIAKTPPPRV
jgi:hypothetical protein